MKNIFLITIGLIFMPVMLAEDDPFQDPYNGKIVKKPRWEEILSDDSKYDDEVIFIDGFLKVNKLGAKNYGYYLFIDTESLEYNRDMRCFEIDSVKLNAFFFENVQMTDAEMVTLNGRYVKILGIYSKSKNGLAGEERIGKIGGPISIYFREHEVTRLQNGIIHVK